MSNYFPTSLAEVSSYSDATFLGGATDIMPLLKCGVRDDKTLVFLSHIPELQKISVAEKTVKIGATVTLSDIAEAKETREYLPALAQAAEVVASPQIRNIATLAGNLLQDRRCIYFNQSEQWRSALPLCFKTGGYICHQMPNSPTCRAIYYSDTATALVLYDAEVEYLYGGDIHREKVENLLKRHIEMNGRSCHEHLQVAITAFYIPVPDMGEHSGFHKYAMRTSIDFPLINFALRCGGVRPPKVVVGAVAPEPVILDKTAALLCGNASDDEVTSACEAELCELARPIREACIPPAQKKNLYKQIDELLFLRRCME